MQNNNNKRFGTARYTILTGLGVKWKLERASNFTNSLVISSWISTCLLSSLSSSEPYTSTINSHVCILAAQMSCYIVSTSNTFVYMYACVSIRISVHMQTWVLTMCPLLPLLPPVSPHPSLHLCPPPPPPPPPPLPLPPPT